MINPFDIFGPSGETSADGLSSEANAFVNAIADNESAGKWNVIYGGKTFDDYSKHPNIAVKIKSGPNKGKYSTAAGKFQILKPTYDEAAKALGITDFTPASQKRIAWYLALRKVPNLQAILETGDKKLISAAAGRLSGVWTSLHGGIEQTQSSKGFIKAYDKYIETGESMIPPAGMPSDLDTAVLSYVDYGRGPLNGRLPTDLKRMSKEAVTRHQSVVDSVSKLMKDGVVVPEGTRNLKNTASTVIDFPAADLIAAGVNSMGMSSIPADPKGPLPKPSPLAPWGNRPAVAGKVVAPGVIDVGTSSSSSSLAKAPTSTVSYPKVQPYSTPSKAPVAGIKVPQLSQRTTPPLAPKVNPKVEGGSARDTGGAATQQPAMSVNDQKLAQLVRTMQVAKTGVEKSKGIAGTAELPKGYKPPAGIIPGTEPKKPASKAQPVMNPVAAATGARTNAPVSLSNPVLQPVKVTPKKATVTQTVTKPLPFDLADVTGLTLAAEPAKKALPKGVVEAKPKSAATPAWGATVPALGAKPAATPVKPVVAAKPVVKVSAPIKKTGLLDPGSVLKKTLVTAPAGKVVQTNLKDLNPDGTAKIKGAVTKIKPPMSPLDILGDIFFNNGADTVGLIGGALMGNKPRDIGQAERTKTLADMAAGKPVTTIAAVKAQTGMSSAQAYNAVASQNNSQSGKTSSGQNKTTTTGESWAANFGSG